MTENTHPKIDYMKFLCHFMYNLKEFYNCYICSALLDINFAGFTIILVLIWHNS